MKGTSDEGRGGRGAWPCQGGGSHGLGFRPWKRCQWRAVFGLEDLPGTGWGHLGKAGEAAALRATCGDVRYCRKEIYSDVGAGPSVQVKLCRTRDWGKSNEFCANGKKNLAKGPSRGPFEP